jgi:hypothetical protein
MTSEASQYRHHQYLARAPRIRKMKASRSIVTCLLLLIWAAASGCTTLADAKLARGTGASRLYPVSQDVVWSLLPGVIQVAGLDYVDGNRSEGYALAQHSMNLLTYGENVAIFVEPGTDVSTTRVEVVSKRALATNITATNWEETILDGLGRALQGRSSQVSIDSVGAVPYLDTRGRDGYREWLTYGEHRAFAISADGSWGASSDKPDLAGNANAASERALDLCRLTAKRACSLYAIDHQVIWQHLIDPGTSG